MEIKLNRIHQQLSFCTVNEQSQLRNQFWISRSHIYPFLYLENEIKALSWIAFMSYWRQDSRATKFILTSYGVGCRGILMVSHWLCFLEWFFCWWKCEREMTITYLYVSERICFWVMTSFKFSMPVSLHILKRLVKMNNGAIHVREITPMALFFRKGTHPFCIIASQLVGIENWMKNLLFLMKCPIQSISLARLISFDAFISEYPPDKYASRRYQTSSITDTKTWLPMNLQYMSLSLMAFNEI